MLYKTPVKVLDRTFDVFGFSEEGWFGILSNSHKFEEQNGFNLEALKTLIKPDSICLDIGANYGIFSLAMSQLAKQVIAFEPDTQCLIALARTLEGIDNVTVHPWIVGREDTTGSFVEDPEWRSSSHFVPGQGEAVCRSLDSMNLERVDFIKVDAEGSELDILEGAEKTLMRLKPTTILEFNSYALINYRNINPNDALRFIQSVFPKVRYYKDGQPTEINHEEFIELNRKVLVNDLLCTWE